MAAAVAVDSEGEDATAVLDFEGFICDHTLHLLLLTLFWERCDHACPRLLYYGDESEVVPLPAQIQVVQTGPNRSGIADLDIGIML